MSRPACFRWCVSYHRDFCSRNRRTILCILHPNRLPVHIQEQLQAWSLLLGQICAYIFRAIAINLYYVLTQTSITEFPGCCDSRFMDVVHDNRVLLPGNSRRIGGRDELYGRSPRGRSHLRNRVLLLPQIWWYTLVRGPSWADTTGARGARGRSKTEERVDWKYRKKGGERIGRKTDSKGLKPSQCTLERLELAKHLFFRLRTCQDWRKDRHDKAQV